MILYQHTTIETWLGHPHHPGHIFSGSSGSDPVYKLSGSAGSGLAALHNISKICPSFSTILQNTYRAPVRLFVVGEGEISSTEGTTQGDSLAMSMYALAMVPLICCLCTEVPDVSQVWFADDASAVGSLSSLLTWWRQLSSYGPAYGYFTNAVKTILIVKPEHLTPAQQFFADTNIQITARGQRHLGAVLGSREFAEEYVADKVQSWVSKVSALAGITNSRPHAAFSAFQGRWSRPKSEGARPAVSFEDQRRKKKKKVTAC